GILKSLERAEIRLQEAPAGLCVVGEGVALRVAQASRLALVEPDVLLAAQVEAVVVAVLGGDETPGVLRIGISREAEEKGQEKADCARRLHCILQPPMPPCAIDPGFRKPVNGASGGLAPVCGHGLRAASSTRAPRSA